MRILFDQGTPVPLRRFLRPHHIETAFERGWSTLKNSELLQAAEQEGFDILLTTDQNLRHQQNLAIRRIGVLVLSTTSWPRIQGAISEILDAVDSVSPGCSIEVEIP